MIGRTHGGEGEKSDPRIATDNGSEGVGRRDRDLRELDGIGIGHHGAVGKDHDPVITPAGIGMDHDEGR